MSKQNKTLKPLSIAIGTTFAVSMAASNIASAAPAGENPFAMSELESGYMQVAEKEGKCGEGKCGEGKKADAKDKEGKCGEGKCGEGKCGDDKKKADKKEGKCGEGKCGGSN
ncbi:MAG: low-complexity protein [Thioalkalispiraceae bacterium]|jgi:uncharacterized low-complexity protein